MKNKIYLSLALLMGTTHLFGAEANLFDPNELFYDNNPAGNIMPLSAPDAAPLVSKIQKLYQEHGIAAPDLLQLVRDSYEKNAKKFAGLVIGKGMLSWGEKDINRALNSVLNQALLYEDDNNTYHAGSLADLVTADYLYSFYNKSPDNMTYRISNFVENAWRAKEHAGSQSNPRQDVVKLDFLLQNRNKAEDAQLRNALLKIHNPSFPVVGGRYGIDLQLGKALMHAGVFELNSENPQTKELINKMRYTENLKTNEDAKKIALANLQPDSGASAPGTSGAGTSTPQLTQEEVVTELLVELAAATDTDKINLVKQALQDNRLKDINTIGRFGNNILQWAAFRGYPSLVKELLALGANPALKNSFNKTALQMAEEANNLDVIALLKPQTAGNTEFGSLHSMITNPKETNEHRIQAIESALSTGKLASINKQDDASGMGLLHIAAAQGNTELASWLLQQGADESLLTNSGETPLQVAKKYKRSEVITMLEPAIAQPEASSKPSAEQIKQLAQEAAKAAAGKAAPQQTKSQKALLTELFKDLSNEERLLKDVKQAVASGELTDINEQEDSGETALRLGALKGYPKFVKYLLEIGADPNAKNSIGKTALDIAKNLKHQEVIAILEPLTGQPAPSADAEQPQGQKEHKDTVEAIVKHHTGPALTHQDIRVLWLKLNKGGEFNPDVAQQLIAYASDPEGATDRTKNPEWRVSTQLIRSNPNLLDGLTGVGQETKDAWKRIAASR